MFIVRFFVFLAAIIGVYVLSNIFMNMHDVIYVSYLDYELEVSNGFAVMSFAILCVVVGYIIRIIAAIIALPGVIAEKFSKAKEKKASKRILRAYSDVMTGKTQEANLSMSNAKKNLPAEYREHVNLILAQSAQSFDQTMHYLRELSEEPEYGYFATKSLAKHYLMHGYSQQAYDCLSQAIKLHNKEEELIRLMIQACASMDLWPEFHDYVQRLSKINKELDESIVHKISKWYLDGVSHYLGQENDSKAMSYAECALNWQPQSLDAIETYCWLNTNHGNNDAVARIIQQAFMLEPSFELFFIYHSSIECKAADAYKIFTDLVSPLDYPSVFIAIAAYLNLTKEVESMRYIMDARS